MRHAHVIGFMRTRINGGTMRFAARLWTTAAIGILALVGCSQPPSAPPPVVLGALYNLTGSHSRLDDSSIRGVRSAVREANAAGGVLGRPIQLEVVDGESDPWTIAAETRSLMQNHPNVAGFVGFSDTDMAFAAAPELVAAQRVLISSGATSPRLPREFPKYLFLACFGDNVQAAAGAEWAFEQLKARRTVVLFNETTIYTLFLHGYFETRFAELGGTIVESRAYRPDSFELALRNLPSADLIYLAGSPEDAVTVVPALRAITPEVPILGGDGLDIGSAWENVESATGVYFTTHAYLGEDSRDPRVLSFRRAFLEQFPDKQPDAFSALGYDAVGLLVQAIRLAGSDQPEAVLDALAGIEGYQGITGEISYVDGSRIPTKTVTVMAVSNGRESLVTEIMPTKVPAP